MDVNIAEARLKYSDLPTKFKPLDYEQQKLNQFARDAFKKLNIERIAKSTPSAWKDKEIPTLTMRLIMSTSIMKKVSPINIRLLWNLRTFEFSRLLILFILIRVLLDNPLWSSIRLLLPPLLYSIADVSSDFLYFFCFLAINNPYSWH